MMHQHIAQLKGKSQLVRSKDSEKIFQHLAIYSATHQAMLPEMTQTNKKNSLWRHERFPYSGLWLSNLYAA